MTIVTVDGVDYPLLTENDMTWAELDEVQTVVGLPITEIQRRSGRCICGHNADIHRPKASRLDDPDSTRCQVCQDGDCPAFSASTPLKATVAFIWISMRRTDSSFTFEQVVTRPLSSFEFKEDEQGPDPTKASGSPTSRPATSDHLPKRSASSPGSGTA